jgi:predicted enzyme related to lactoylglutathione lyase
MRNPLGRFGLYMQDMARARAFSETVFDLSLERPDSPGREVWAVPDGRRAPGAFVHADGAASGRGGTMVCFSCKDCALQAARACGHGGRVRREAILDRALRFRRAHARSPGQPRRPAFDAVMRHAGRGRR